MSSGLYNEGLFREGLLRTTNLVRPGLITQFDTLEEALTRFAVDGVEAALALDFIGSEYRTANTATTFADAFMGNSPKLTYNPGSASSSQSTMTQGYGPELVTNGGFDTDTDWDTGTGWTINTTTGVATCDGTNASQLTLANKVTAGSVYQVEFDVISRTSGNLRVVLGSYGDTVPTSLGRNTVVQTASSDGSLGFRSASFIGSIDNISVREAPKIVWAPHNLLPYSEDLTNSWTVIDATIDDSETVSFDLASSAITGVAATTSVGAGYTVAVEIWSETDAGKQVDIGFNTNNLSNTFSDLITLTATPTLHSFSKSNNTATENSLRIRNAGEAKTIKVRAARLYRSDLGGMAPVPQSATGFETYVPTNGAAEYLPRVGHHVFNGSAWVNEGLLIESEARTNLVTYSNSNWVAINAGTVDENNTTGPDGENSATLYTPPAATGIRGIATTAYTSATGALSVYIKSNGIDTVSLWHNNGASGTVVFNLLTGETSGATNLDGYGMEDVGNGWWRCFIYSSTYATQTIRVYGGVGSAVAYNGTDGFYVYGAQHETAPTPSSYIPTSGSTVTRGAQSLTVPAHWYDVDNPTYTGPELVTDFSTYASEAEFFADGFVRSDVTKVTFDATNDTLEITDGSNVRIDGHVPFVEGVTYEVSITNDGPDSLFFQDNFTSFNLGVAPGTSSFVFTKSSGSNVRVVVSSGATASISNVSVRQVSAPQFGWPEPEYIGPELVDNGDFSLGDNGDWTKINSSITTEGVLDGSDGLSMLYQDVLTNGRLYHVSFDATVSAGNIEVINNDGTELYSATTSTTHSFVFKQQIANGNLLWRCRSGSNAGSIDNISVREINPLSVSIQMDGRMTYADEDTNVTVRPYRWYIDSSNNVSDVWIRTDSSFSGAVQINQAYGGSSSFVRVDTYTPGVLVPFNISSRHGSTFVNGAVDGVALTADTTPTALPDLSGTDLQIAYDFMGTIGTFRQFAGDIGDAGLVTATNPSTEPTLSLTFDGTGGSYYNLSWSE